MLSKTISQMLDSDTSLEKEKTRIPGTLRSILAYRFISAINALSPLLRDDLRLVHGKVLTSLMRRIAN